MDEKLQRYFSEVEIIEKEFFKILKEFNFKQPKCLNLQEEKKKFFRAIADDKYYNPQLKFVQKKFNEDAIQKLKQLKIPTFFDKYGIKRLYKEKIKLILARIEYHENWGDARQTTKIIAVKGKPSKKLFLNALTFCKKFKREKVKFRKIKPQKIGEELQKYVKEQFGVEIFVEYTEIPSGVNIEPKLNLIEINPHYRFTTLDLERLKAHEIDVHYKRYFNGKKTKLRLLQIGTAKYLETEEGLAVYNEEQKGVLSKAQLFVYAGRVIATHLCLTKSFFEIFEYLTKLGFNYDTAFAITYRSKRNLKDTSQKGGFTKDYIYYSGYLKIKEFVKKGGNVENLMAGKLALDEEKIIKRYLEELKK